jgi:hypothetical protein
MNYGLITVKPSAEAASQSFVSAHKNVRRTGLNPHQTIAAAS